MDYSCGLIIEKLYIIDVTHEATDEFGVKVVAIQTDYVGLV